VRRHKRILFHTDAVQAAPYLDVDVAALDVDMLSVAAHKFEGPKGVGALYVRHGTNVLAQQQGGAQERYRRAGTENVAGAVGLATALELAVAERPVTAARLRRLRETLATHLRALQGVQETGHPIERLPGLLSVVAAGLDGNAVTMALDLAGLACSTGSACVSGSAEISHVLAAMGYPEDEATGALRFSIGRTTAEIAEAAHLVGGTIESQREAADKLAAQRAAALSRPVEEPAGSGAASSPVTGPEATGG
jgi:cysteine desulfurase